MGLSCLSLLGQKGSPGKWRKQPTVYREHLWPICRPLKVDLFQCYYVHYASCGSVQQYNDQVYILSLWVGGVTVWGRGWGAALVWSYSGKACSDSCIYKDGLRVFWIFFQGNERLWVAFCCLFFKTTWTLLPSLLFPHVSAPLLWASPLLMDVMESQLIGRCDGVPVRVGQWWGENKKYKLTLKAAFKTNKTAVRPKCGTFHFFYQSLSVLSVNNWSR